MEFYDPMPYGDPSPFLTPEQKRQLKTAGRKTLRRARRRVTSMDQEERLRIGRTVRALIPPTSMFFIPRPTALQRRLARARMIRGQGLAWGPGDEEMGSWVAAATAVTTVASAAGKYLPGDDDGDDGDGYQEAYEYEMERQAEEREREAQAAAQAARKMKRQARRKKQRKAQRRRLEAAKAPSGAGGLPAGAVPLGIGAVLAYLLLS